MILQVLSREEKGKSFHPRSTIFSSSSSSSPSRVLRICCCKRILKGFNSHAFIIDYQELLEIIWMEKRTQYHLQAQHVPFLLSGQSPSFNVMKYLQIQPEALYNRKHFSRITSYPYYKHIKFRVIPRAMSVFRVFHFHLTSINSSSDVSWVLRGVSCQGW